MCSPRSCIARLLLTAAAASVVALTAPRAAAQQGIGTIRGAVRDEVSGKPIPSAQVYVPGLEAVQGVTNAEGQFEISLSQGTHPLTARRVGYAPSSIRVSVTAGQITEVRFALRQVVVLLDEVVVTGTGGPTERRRLGNTVASIRAADLEHAEVLNFSEFIAAREPGVVVQPSSGLAGEGARIRVRGSASLTLSNEPIVYIDGVRMDGTGLIAANEFFFVGGNGSSSRLDDVNPEAIERVEILKGPAAATLYGTEASNGVIQIFTKRGAAGAPRFDFAMDWGISSPVLSRVKKSTGFARDPAQADFLSLFWGNAPNCRKLTGGPCTALQPFEVFEVDLFDPLFENGFNQSYAASMSGGSATFRYFVSGRFTTDAGTITTEPVDGISDDFDRKVQANANMEILPHEKVRVQVNTQLADVHHETPENSNNATGLLPSALDTKPERATCVTTLGAGTPNGDGTCTPVGNPQGLPGPFWATIREAAQQEVLLDARHHTLSVHSQYRPVSELTLDATVGVDLTTTETVEAAPFGWNVDQFTFWFPTGFRAVDHRNRREITVEAKAQWDRRIGGTMSSTLVVGGQGFLTRLSSLGGWGTNFPGPGLEVTRAAAQRDVTESFLETLNAGAFVQEQLGIGDVVFLTGGARYDRNSTFGTSTPGALYPKASLSFIPSDLAAWRSAVLSTVRLRAAWGKSGLQPGAYDKFTTFRPVASDLGPGLVAGNLGSEELKPEKASEIELGAEVGLFDDRLGVEVTWWDRVTKDALFSRQFAPSGGFSRRQLFNVGQIDAHGLEINLHALIVNRPGLSLRFFGNASYLNEVVTDIGDAPPIRVGGSFPAYLNWLVEGWSPGAFFGARLLPTAPGFYPVDTNGDGQPDTEAQLLAHLSNPVPPDPDWPSQFLRPLLEICDATQVPAGPEQGALGCYLGKPTPDWQGSLGVKLGILGNLEVSTLFEYKAGNFFVYNFTDMLRSLFAPIGRNFAQATQVEATLMNPASTPEERLAAWRIFAEELKHPIPSLGLNAVVPADFVRWRELSLTYRIPAGFVQSKLGLRYLSLTAAFRNLALWTKYDGTDPESNVYSRGGEPGSGGAPTLGNNFGDNIDAYNVPLPRRFSFSIRFGF